MSNWWNFSEADLGAFSSDIAAYHARADGAPGSPDFNRSHSAYRKAFKNTARDLRRLSETSNRSETKKLSAALFKRPYAQLTAVLFTAWQSDRDDLSAPLSQKQARLLARRVGKFWAVDEEVLPAHKLKPDGSLRPIWKFLYVRRSQQFLVRWILSTQLSPYPKDFNLEGMGSIHGAAKAIGKALEDGYRYWITSDIKSAYSSISKSHLRAVCALDERLERYVVFPSLPYTGEKHTTEANAPRSLLPQGAAHSSFFLSALIGGYLGAISLGDVVVIVFADNLAIGAQSPKVANGALCTLRKALSEGVDDFPGGLMLHQIELRDGYRNATHGERIPFLMEVGYFLRPCVDFVGYRTRYDQMDQCAYHSPSHTAWAKFWDKVALDWSKASPGVDLEALHWIGAARYYQWSQSFCLWEKNELSQEHFLISLYDRSFDWWSFQKKAA